jgi:uncharacterized protein (DUF433 family)
MANRTITIQLSPELYERANNEAQSRQQSMENFVTILVAETVLPPHPYVTLVESRSGLRPVIRGTQVGVDVVVGYHQAGYSAAEIVADILPHLTLSQVYDALSYYAERQELFDGEMAIYTPEAWRTRLTEAMGLEAATTLLGG